MSWKEVIDINRKLLKQIQELLRKWEEDRK
jgi:hypothetical protein